MLNRFTILLFIVISILFPSIFALYTIPAQVNLGAKPYPESPNAWEPLAQRLYVARIAYILVAIVLFVLLINLVRVYSIADPIRKETFKYLIGYYFYGVLAATIISVGISVFLLLHKSYTTGVLWGLTYPISIATAVFFAGLAPYFLAGFSFYTTRKEYPSKYAFAILLLIVIYGFSMVIPNNFFGMDAPEGILRLRALSTAILLLLYVMALYPSREIWRVAKLEVNKTRKIRLYILLLGNIFLVLYFVGYFLNELSGLHYGIWVIISLGFLVIAGILYYLSISPPKWLLRKLKAL